MATLAFRLERLRRRQRLRYWALTLPLLIIALALPLLRPLRHPDPRLVSDDEWVRLASIRQIATTGRFALDPETVAGRVSVMGSVSGELVAAQQPMLSVMGAGVYQVLRLSSVSLAPDSVLGPYLMTLLMSTIPTAVTATLLYRCGRLLELPRFRRITLALACVACTGLLPYATVISPYPLAAMLAAAALTCLANAAMVGPPPRSIHWLLLAGFFAALSATIHPSTVFLGALLGLSTWFMPWRRRVRVLGFVLFVVTAAIPLSAHRLLMERVSGGWLLPSGAASVVALSVETPGAVGGVAGGVMAGTRPAAMGAASVSAPVLPRVSLPEPVAALPVEEETLVAPTTFATLVETAVGYVLQLVGPWGLLSHAPAVLLGGSGAVVLLFRYWPKTTRAYAGAALLGVVIPLIVLPLVPRLVYERFYGPTMLLPTLPPLMFFAGLFLRRSWVSPHSMAVTIVAWMAILFSLGTTALGLLQPMPRGGFQTYPPYEVLREVQTRRAGSVNQSGSVGGGPG